MNADSTPDYAPGKKNFPESGPEDKLTPTGLTPVIQTEEERIISSKVTTPEGVELVEEHETVPPQLELDIKETEKRFSKLTKGNKAAVFVFASLTIIFTVLDIMVITSIVLLTIAAGFNSSHLILYIAALLITAFSVVLGIMTYSLTRPYETLDWGNPKNLSSSDL